MFKIYILKRGQNFDGPGCQKSPFSIWLEKSKDHFFDTNDCRLTFRWGSQNFLRSLLTDFSPVAKMVQNGQIWSKRVTKHIKKKTKVGGMGPKAFEILGGYRCGSVAQCAANRVRSDMPPIQDVARYFEAQWHHILTCARGAPSFGWWRLFLS